MRGGFPSYTYAICMLNIVKCSATFPFATHDRMVCVCVCVYACWNKCSNFVTLVVGRQDLGKTQKWKDQF